MDIVIEKDFSTDDFINFILYEKKSDSKDIDVNNRINTLSDIDESIRKKTYKLYEKYISNQESIYFLDFYSLKAIKKNQWKNLKNIFVERKVITEKTFYEKYNRSCFEHEKDIIKIIHTDIKRDLT